jgi:hypothetical protein
MAQALLPTHGQALWALSVDVCCVCLWWMLEVGLALGILEKDRA